VITRKVRVLVQLGSKRDPGRATPAGAGRAILERGRVRGGRRRLEPAPAARHGKPCSIAPRVRLPGSWIYLVSLARSDRIETKVGTYSVHHIRPELFGGFEHDPASGTKLALPEKALFDFLYLSPTRGRLFAACPSSSSRAASAAASRAHGLTASPRAARER